MNLAGYVDNRGFLAAMQSLPKEIRREVRDAMKDGADLIVAKAKELAPVDTYHLKSRIRSRQVNWAKDGMVYEVVSDAVERVSKSGPYPSFQEFGWMMKNGVRNPGHPYFRAAVRLTKSAVRKKIQDAVRIGMEKAVGGKGLSISASNLSALDLVTLA